MLDLIHPLAKLCNSIVTPHTCTRDKVIGSIIIAIVNIHKKIRSQDVGTRAPRNKYNKFVEFGKNWHQYASNCIAATPINHAHHVHPRAFCSSAQLASCVGKGRQQHVHTCPSRHAYVLYRAQSTRYFGLS